MVFSNGSISICRFSGRHRRREVHQLGRQRPFAARWPGPVAPTAGPHPGPPKKKWVLGDENGRNIEKITIFDGKTLGKSPLLMENHQFHLAKSTILWKNHQFNGKITISTGKTDHFNGHVHGDVTNYSLW